MAKKPQSKKPAPKKAAKPETFSKLTVELVAEKGKFTRDQLIAAFLAKFKGLKYPYEGDEPRVDIKFPGVPPAQLKKIIAACSKDVEPNDDE